MYSFILIDEDKWLLVSLLGNKDYFEFLNLSSSQVNTRGKKGIPSIQDTAGIQRIRTIHTIRWGSRGFIRSTGYDGDIYDTSVSKGYIGNLSDYCWCWISPCRFIGLFLWFSVTCWLFPIYLLFMSRGYIQHTRIYIYIYVVIPFLFVRIITLLSLLRVLSLDLYVCCFRYWIKPNSQN